MVLHFWLGSWEDQAVAFATSSEGVIAIIRKDLKLGKGEKKDCVLVFYLLGGVCVKDLSSRKEGINLSPTNLLVPIISRRALSLE